MQQKSFFIFVLDFYGIDIVTLPKADTIEAFRLCESNLAKILCPSQPTLEILP